MPVNTHSINFAFKRPSRSTQTVFCFGFLYLWAITCQAIPTFQDLGRRGGIAFVSHRIYQVRQSQEEIRQLEVGERYGVAFNMKAHIFSSIADNQLHSQQRNILFTRTEHFTKSLPGSEIPTGNTALKVQSPVSMGFNTQTLLSPAARLLMDSESPWLLAVETITFTPPLTEDALKANPKAIHNGQSTVTFYKPARPNSKKNWRTHQISRHWQPALFRTTKASTTQQLPILTQHRQLADYTSQKLTQLTEAVERDYLQKMENQSAATTHTDDEVSQTLAEFDFLLDEQADELIETTEQLTLAQFPDTNSDDTEFDEEPAVITHNNSFSQWIGRPVVEPKYTYGAKFRDNGKVEQISFPLSSEYMIMAPFVRGKSK
ncbi:hypothetical protein [Parendozoicomonas haliclonae]|uniref:Uncharacterized protein n=1 Tax=Parendozoicomonas haliclonae TaxID=1960125 RepID=A0A1X7AQI0_9GAMM|nr:hypothetical protein [Parendozoicomonas haliclonae]SMA50349.1 hypothetical protein EHSB41UT_04146 [Parendozoicomonas haliclonae]